MLQLNLKAVDKVEYARERQIDFIICDHHTPGDELPRAVAVLNMKRADCPYPFKELSGCGVGFKLVQAYAMRAGIAMEQIYPLLPPWLSPRTSSPSRARTDSSLSTVCAR